MDNSEEEMEEDDTEWKNSFVGSVPLSPAAAAAGPNLSKTPGPAHRVILHLDLDCFYAQVEMIRNPALRLVPLGIQQKYIIVTCNYVAREQGVTKLMSVTEAKERCPELVLVRGEDLTHYRETSYKLTELLTSFCPLVERLGFDENFMDITKMVEERLAQTPETHTFSFQGHVYNHPSADVEAGEHPRLAAGSHIAAELREVVHSRLGLTGCAGVATNKLLAKLVSGTFKPNQQTTLLPGDVGDIMGCLSSLRKVPGVGHQTAKRLQALGLVSVTDLQLFPLNDLAREFGAPSAQRLKNLSLGVDDSPVAPTGAPQSLSDEDSFKKISSTKEVLEKIEELLSSLTERMHKDGRQPQTFRLTIRRYSATNKWFSRESRQCPVPPGLGQKISSDSSPDEAVVQLLPLAMKLFHKMVDGASFHLTLINVCFSNLQAKGAAVGRKGSITSFFTPRNTHDSSSQSQEASSHCTDHQFSFSGVKTHHASQSTTGRGRSEAALHGVKNTQRPVVDPQPQSGSCSSVTSEPEETNTAPTHPPPPGVDPEETNTAPTHPLPPGVDPDVFRLLPEDIRQELLHTHRPSDSIKHTADRLDPPDGPTTVKQQQPAACSMFPGEDVTAGGVPSSLRSPDCQFPGNVDPRVFSELPPDLQRELMTEWRQQRPVLKSRRAAGTSSETRDRRAAGTSSETRDRRAAGTSSETRDRRAAGTSSETRDRRAAGRSRQANNLFKYFKPS